MIKSYEMAKFSGEMMRSLMFDLLDLAQVERGTFRVNNEYFDLTQVLKNAFDVLQHQASNKKVHLQTQFDTDAKFFTSIYGDERRYMQILINFISNSLKFSPRDATIVVALKILQSVVKNQQPAEPDQSPKSPTSPKSAGGFLKPRRSGISVRSVSNLRDKLAPN